MLVTALSFTFLYQLCDDIFVLLLLQGGGLSPGPTEYNLLLNVFLSLGLNGLYHHFPAVQWYSLFLVGVGGLSLWAILLAARWGPHRALRTGLTLLAAGGYVYLITILQWTTVSALAAIGGILLLGALWSEKHRAVPRGALGLVAALILFSILIRFDSFLLVLILCLPMIVWAGWKAEMTPTRSLLLKFMAALILVAGLAVGGNRLYIDRDPGWVRAVKFFNLQADLLNGYSLEYDDRSKPVFDFVGWSQLDLGLFVNWYYQGEEAYSVEKLEMLRKGLPRLDLRKHLVESPGVIFKLASVQCVFWSAVLFLFFVPRSRLRVLAVQALWVGAVLTGLWLYLKIPERVFLPAVLLMLNLVILGSVSGEESPKRLGNLLPGWKVMGVLALAVVFALNLRLLRWEMAQTGRILVDDHAFHEEMDRFTPPPGGLCVIWDSAFPYERQNAFEDFRFFKKMDWVTLAWYQRTPTTKAMLEKHGVPNLFRDMVDNPQVTMICTPWEADVYGVYLRDKYGIQASLVPTFQSPFFTAYQARSEKAPAR